MEDFVRLDVIVDEEPSADDEEQQRRTAALLKTKSLLTTWRSRFSTEEVERDYSPSKNERMVVTSGAQGQVRAVHHRTDGNQVTYDFDQARAGSELEVEELASGGAAEPVANVTPDHFEALSLILFTCDRIQMEG